MAVDSRPYPVWWIERARERRSVLDAAVRRLRVAVAEDPRIVGALIFGSYAEDRVGPQSDLDLIVVTTMPACGDAGGRHAAIARRLDLGVPCDLIVYERAEYERLLRESRFVAQARSRGMWIDAATPD